MSRRLIAFAASNSSRSINKQLLQAVAGMVQQAQLEILDLNDFELPLFSVDQEDRLGEPQLAQEFFRRMGDCDGIIISFAEHNGCYSVAYKNIFDWASRIDPKVYQNKPMVLLATSPGGRGGRSVLELAEQQIPRFGGQVLATVSVPGFFDNFDAATNQLTSDAIRAEIQAAIDLLVTA